MEFDVRLLFLLLMSVSWIFMFSLICCFWKWSMNKWYFIIIIMISGYVFSDCCILKSYTLYTWVSNGFPVSVGYFFTKPVGYFARQGWGWGLGLEVGYGYGICGPRHYPPPLVSLHIHQGSLYPFRGIKSWIQF